MKADEILRSDGEFTLDLSTGQLVESGFAVSRTDGSLTIRAESFFADRFCIHRYLRRERRCFSPGVVHLGAWLNAHRDIAVDPELSGRPTVVLLPTVVLPDRDDAVCLGAALNQIAVYDLASGVEILT